MVIAVDFDGTIVEHKYPKIGKEKPFAIATLKRLQNEGHRIALCTVNANYSDEQQDEPGYSRKIKADIFIDDRNLGGLPDWETIYEMVHNRWGYNPYLNKRESEKRAFWKKIWRK